MSIKIKRQRGYVEFCEDMSLQAAWEHANAELQEAQQKPQRTMNNPDLKAKAQAVVDAENAMADSVLVFELEALSRKKWQEFEAANPPRPGNSEDETLRFDQSKFFDAVFTFVDAGSPEPHPTIVSVKRKKDGEPVEFNPATDWVSLADEMTDGQFNEFALKAILLNRGNAGVPFSRAASQLMERSGKS